MARLLIHVEGQTEEAFVNEVLREHFQTVGYEVVSARIIGNARLKSRRGGIRPWPSVRKDIVNHLRGDAGCIATTMVDYYGLPQDGDAAWPGRSHASRLGAQQKADCVEAALSNDIACEIGDHEAARRFVPFVVMYEFEGLLFSDCAAFSRSLGRSELERKLRAVRDDFDTPEDINDSPTTAPSKRVGDIIPGYEKPLFGTVAALEIGLARIRTECPHFASWLTRLEQLVRE